MEEWKTTEENRIGEEGREEERRVMSQNNGILNKSCTFPPPNGATTHCGFVFCSPQAGL